MSNQIDMSRVTVTTPSEMPRDGLVQVCNAVRWQPGTRLDESGDLRRIVAGQLRLDHPVTLSIERPKIKGGPAYVTVFRPGERPGKRKYAAVPDEGAAWAKANSRAARQ